MLLKMTKGTVPFVIFRQDRGRFSDKTGGRFSVLSARTRQRTVPLSCRDAAAVLAAAILLTGCTGAAGSGAAGSSAGAGKAAEVTQSAAPAEAQPAALSESDKLSREIFAMDTYMTLTAYGPEAERALSAAVDEIGRLDALLSTGSEDSEISRLNARSGSSPAADSDSNAAQAETVSAAAGDTAAFTLSTDSAALMKESLALYRDTAGAFDVTIYPMMKLWGFTSGEYRVPSDDEIRETLSLVGSDAIAFDEASRAVTFSKEGTEIDFGGIAKGYTSGRIMEVFRENGVKSGIVSLGGNVHALGLKPDGSRWNVAIRSPENDGSFLGIVEAEDEAVITSGGYERYFESDGQTYHHILDPETGRPAESGLKSVTIVCGDGTQADGLSTALFVMGEEKAFAFWRAHKDTFDCILLTEDDRLLASGGLRETFSSEHKIEWIDS